MIPYAILDSMIVIKPLWSMTNWNATYYENRVNPRKQIHSGAIADKYISFSLELSDMDLTTSVVKTFITNTNFYGIQTERWLSTRWFIILRSWLINLGKRPLSFTISECLFAVFIYYILISNYKILKYFRNVVNSELIGTKRIFNLVAFCDIHRFKVILLI